MSVDILGSRKIGQRYAKALFSLALKHDCLDWVSHNVKAIAKLFESQPLLVTWLSSPKANVAEQRAFVETYLQEDASWLTQRFLRLLAEARRLLFFPFIAEQFSLLLDRHTHVASATVTSAVPLREEAVLRLKEVLQQRFSLREVRLTQQVDASILGGLVVDCLDQRLDTSLKARLAQLQQALAS